MEQKKLESEDEKEKWCLIFLKYYTNIENSTIIRLSLDILIKNCLNNREILSMFIETALGFYKDIPYHNSTHGFNTLYSGSLFLNLLEKYNVNQKKRFIFLICCLLHDINHPGSKEYKAINLDFEFMHIGYVKDLISQFLPHYLSDMNVNLIKELILATNLLLHDEIVNEFTVKYFNEDKSHDKQSTREIGTLELKMLIKIADISTAYKGFESFSYSSMLLEKEIFGVNAKDNTSRLKADLKFLNRFAMPLAKKFSAVFSDFNLLYENVLENIRKIKDLLN